MASVRELLGVLVAMNGVCTGIAWVLVAMNGVFTGMVWVLVAINAFILVPIDFLQVFCGSASSRNIRHKVFFEHY